MIRVIINEAYVSLGSSKSYLKSRKSKGVIYDKSFMTSSVSLFLSHEGFVIGMECNMDE